MSDEAKNERRDPREVAAEILGAAVSKKSKARLDGALSRYREKVREAGRAALREIRGSTDPRAARDFSESKLRLLCIEAAGLCGTDETKKLWTERYEELLEAATEAETSEIVGKLDEIRAYFGE